MGAYSWNPDQNPEYGASTCNRHPDGSGICYSSLRRPLLMMRPGYSRSSIPADLVCPRTHVLYWLTVKGFAFNVVTDHDLYREGAGPLRAYRAVVTGSHPEYHTPNTLDALHDYVDGGGRLAYVGGNGFYWRTATSPEIRDVGEIHRTEVGIRTWAIGDFRLSGGGAAKFELDRADLRSRAYEKCCCHSVLRRCAAIAVKFVTSAASV